MKRHQSGFSLVEILVVLAIIAILSSILYINVSQGSAQSRDAQRQADLRAVSNALELYKNKYGEYPQGCNAAGTWSGHALDYACSSGNQYIVGLAPEFISRLPQDPKLNGNNSGYVYATNVEGSAYIMKARLTVESETIGYDHPFKSCDTDNSSSLGPVCNKLSSNLGGSRPAWCATGHPTFDTSFGIWGGVAEEQYGWIHVGYPFPGAHPRAQESTEEVRCIIE